MTAVMTVMRLQSWGGAVPFGEEAPEVADIVPSPHHVAYMQDNVQNPAHLGPGEVSFHLAHQDDYLLFGRAQRCLGFSIIDIAGCRFENTQKFQQMCNPRGDILWQ